MSDFVDTKALSFSLPNQDGEVRTLESYSGKHILLYFYPKDMTSGCTTESIALQEHIDDFTQHNITIVGVSPQDVTSKKKFCDKHGFTFDLLADEERSLIEGYGLWVEKSMYGRKYMGVNRESFLISQDGTILKHYKKVKPAEHAAEVLSDAQELLS